MGQIYTKRANMEQRRRKSTMNRFIIFEYSLCWTYILFLYRVSVGLRFLPANAIPQQFFGIILTKAFVTVAFHVSCDEPMENYHLSGHLFLPL